MKKALKGIAMKTKLILAAAAAMLLAGVATAQPSEYFIWKNNATGKTVCEPQMPADQWTKQSGPYEDANCKFKVPG
jgi:hypothetical protein